MPLASMSKVTSIFGTPRGAGMMPSRWKRPSVRLYRASVRSPWSTWTSTEGWLSVDVEKNHVLDVSGEHAGLHGSADRHHLVRVDAAVRVFAEETLDRLLNERHA